MALIHGGGGGDVLGDVRLSGGGGGGVIWAGPRGWVIVPVATIVNKSD